MKGNTEGSLSNKLAYIAGFLDGDGSIMLQLKKRRDGDQNSTRFMATVCFYQDKRHISGLKFIKRTLKAGYLSLRKDGISELRIQGFKEVARVLQLLQPFIRFKNIQTKHMLSALKVLVSNSKRKISEKSLRKVVHHILCIQKSNYVAKTKKTKKDFLKMLGITP